MGGERQIGDLLAEIKGGGRTGRHEGSCLTFHTGKRSFEIVSRFS